MEPTSTADAPTPLFLTRVALLLVASTRGAFALSDDGSVIDRVDIDQQPALDHLPDHGSHKFQMVKPDRSIKEIVSSSGIATTRLQELHQTWRKRGSCPAGTVPIRRPSANANPATAEVAGAYGNY
ncbi:hypothetical protein E2562_004735 [Oryza meyeriana var. granulata]|uniref:Neprosin activation peptide domain-containing protein n=1 Tax=Oryza meyeriana var. granulata TaxID=110450 RepID=A0A6G1DEC8_9ORYZ|nr:hypothetical protein E2562_004735 [Oryza meyeriana var. granulata]